MRGIMGTRGITAGTRGITVGTRGVMVVTRGITVGMRGIKVRMREIMWECGEWGWECWKYGECEESEWECGEWGENAGNGVGNARNESVKAGNQGGNAGNRGGDAGNQGGLRGIEWNRNRKKTKKKFMKSNFLFFLNWNKNFTQVCWLPRDFELNINCNRFKLFKFQGLSLKRGFGGCGHGFRGFDR